MTQQNLYQPPQAQTADIRLEVAKRSPRPIAAWLLLALLALFTLTLFAGAWRSVWTIALDGALVRSPGRLAAFAAGQIALFVVCVAVILAIFRGKSWARWVGLALIVAFAIWSVARKDHAVYANEAEAVGAALARNIVLPALNVWWAWAFAFTRKSRRFFGGQADAA